MTANSFPLRPCAAFFPVRSVTRAQELGVGRSIVTKIGQLAVLETLYHRVSITPEVHAEVALAGAGRKGCLEIDSANWILVDPTDHKSVLLHELSSALGAGEVSTVRLAIKRGARLALMDDRRARSMATHNGVTPLGCVGILAGAYRKGLLTDLRDAYRSLLGSGSYVDSRIVNATLKLMQLPEL